MQVYIHYNLHGGTPEAHAEVKRQMIENLGYYDNFMLGSMHCNLPNTSLWHLDRIDSDAAKNDLNNVVAIINRGRTTINMARIERCVAMIFTGVSAIEGDPHRT